MLYNPIQGNGQEEYSNYTEGQLSAKIEELRKNGKHKELLQILKNNELIWNSGVDMSRISEIKMEVAKKLYENQDYEEIYHLYKNNYAPTHKDKMEHGEYKLRIKLIRGGVFGIAPWSLTNTVDSILPGHSWFELINPDGIVYNAGMHSTRPKLWDSLFGMKGNFMAKDGYDPQFNKSISADKVLTKDFKLNKKQYQRAMGVLFYLHESDPKYGILRGKGYEQCTTSLYKVAKAAGVSLPAEDAPNPTSLYTYFTGNTVQYGFGKKETNPDGATYSLMANVTLKEYEGGDYRIQAWLEQEYIRKRRYTTQIGFGFQIRPQAKFSPEMFAYSMLKFDSPTSINIPDRLGVNFGVEARFNYTRLPIRLGYRRVIPFSKKEKSYWEYYFNANIKIY